MTPGLPRRHCSRMGVRPATGREIIVTPQADADGPLIMLKALRAYPVDRKRAVLHALGAEIARLHRCGFVHGDLTPFNILFVRAEPPRFVLIDHERTHKAGPLAPRRRMLRNLVQLPGASICRASAPPIACAWLLAIWRCSIATRHRSRGDSTRCSRGVFGATVSRGLEITANRNGAMRTTQSMMGGGNGNG